MAIKQRSRATQQSVVAMLLLAGLCVGAEAQITSEPIPAAVPGSVQSRQPDGLAGGVVLNRTITIVGFDFYQYFSTAWRTREKNEQYSISIVERPTAIRGSEIWVEYRNRRVFQTFLSPTRSSIKAVSQKAVGIVYKRVVDLDLQQLLYQDHDLAREELP